MKTILDIPDLKGKKVLLRVDFDVPVENEKIMEQFRIAKQKKTLDFLLDKGAWVLMVAHISATKSFEPIVPQLEKILGHKIRFLKEIENSSLEQLNLLDNIRKWPGEEDNSEDFARILAEGFDVYINNCFSTSHRNHSSFVSVAKLIPAYAGPLIKEETEQLQKIIDAPKEGKILIMGGAKASTKIPVIKNLINNSEAILVGGVIANDIFKFKGIDVGNAIVDNNLEELFSGLDLNDPRIILPEDFNLFENKMSDIGPSSIKKFTDIIKQAKMVLWNGPMGVFEDERFVAGTKGVAEAMAESNAFKVLGGGDTIAAISKFKIQNSKFNFISTGGGAMLVFLAGDKLPGLEVLGYYNQND